MKKTFCRRISRCVCTAMAAVLLFGISAQAAPLVSPQEIGMDAASLVEPKSEELKYYFRIYNGKWQYRIWSVTYGRWVTDWIDFE